MLPCTKGWTFGAFDLNDALFGAKRCYIGASMKFVQKGEECHYANELHLLMNFLTEPPGQEPL